MLEIQAALEKILIKSKFLSERLRHTVSKANSDHIVPEFENILDRWCQVVASEDEKTFNKRLKWDGLERDSLVFRLADRDSISSQGTPNWIGTLRLIIETALTFSIQEPECESVSHRHKAACHRLNSNTFRSCLDPEEPLPFEDIFLPMLQVARQKLLARLGSKSLSSDSLPLSLLSEVAYLKLERNLLQRLVFVCSRTLSTEFSLFRPIGLTLFTLFQANTKQEPGSQYYDAFVLRLAQDGLLSFFKKYPVIARLIAVAIDLWVEATAEFLVRLQIDSNIIQQFFGGVEQRNRTSKVIFAYAGLSDPHYNGRSVIRLTFENGLRLVYKPKNLGLEAAYVNFLDWCNNNGAPLPFKLLKVLDRETHGWVEYIEHLPCENKESAHLFYQRAGMQLCTMYILGTTDCHSENLIASGDHLVLVDMETLMHPEAIPLGDDKDAGSFDSVLRTGLLPSWDCWQNTQIIQDSSGLGAVEPQPMHQRGWVSVNTDDMNFSIEQESFPLNKNVPMLNGAVLSPNDYIEDFVSGFEEMYRFFMVHKEVLLTPKSQLSYLNHQPVRFIFRPTSVYYRILQRSLSPEFLQNGLDWSIELEYLGYAFLSSQEKPLAWPVFKAEISALSQLDIPIFAADSGRDDLIVQSDHLKQFFKDSSYKEVIKRIKLMGEMNLKQQIEIIRGAFYTRTAQTHFEKDSPTLVSIVEATQPEKPESNSITSENLLEEARIIAQEISQRAIHVSSNSSDWLGLTSMQNNERFRVNLIGHDFYNGRCGIALFLSALQYVTNTCEYRELTLSALHPLRELLQSPNISLTKRVAKYMGIGGASGLGSVIYSLVKISKFLQEPKLIDDSYRAAGLLTVDLINTDHQLDVIGGAGGAILGLLTLYREIEESDLLNKAVYCGQHLIKHQLNDGDSTGAWKTIKSERPLTGFSHGAAGIAYSLLRLYEITKDKDYLKAAQNGIAYEKKCFSLTARNWPDFRQSRKGDQDHFSVTWCHGAPGICLARLGSLSILDTKIIREDIEQSLATTSEILESRPLHMDHLCCGNLGLVDVLLTAASKLSNTRFSELAWKQTGHIFTRAKKNGAYRLQPFFNPTFFQGMAGIGYELLRVIFPSKLPSVILWE